MARVYTGSAWGGSTKTYVGGPPPCPREILAAPGSWERFFAFWPTEDWSGCRRWLRWLERRSWAIGGIGGRLVFFPTDHWIEIRVYGRLDLYRR